MIQKLVRRLSKNELQTEQDDALKLIFLALTNFFIIGSYSILRSLKTSIFLGLVGKEYVPHTRIITIILLIPTMILYAKLVDRLKRYQLVYFFLGIYGILYLVFAYFLNHSVYGLHNTLTSPWRILGWSFEIFMDLYQVLIVGTFWSFVTSISTPSFANSNYGFIVAAARIGGILSTGLSILLLVTQAKLESWISIPFLVIVSAFFLIGAALCIYLLAKKISPNHLHGYQAAYDADKKSEHSSNKPTIWEGIKLMITEPYVLGIFAMVYGFEIVNAIFDYQMQVFVSLKYNNEVLAMTKFMLFYTLSFQIVGFFLAFFGTSKLPKKIGVQKCLLLMPITVIALALYVLALPNLLTTYIVCVIMRAAYYGFNQPVREILYIPTVKDIQFKAKAWTDSFGRSFSKTSGSVVNIATIASNSPYCAILIQSSFSLGIALIWVVIAFMVGKKYQTTIDRNEVIGKKST